MDPARAKTQRKQMRKVRIKRQWNENYDDLLAGFVTMAEILGHSDDKLMEIAEAGLRLLDVGRYEQARKLLQSLPLLDPFVPYFHLLLGMLHEKTQKPYEALEEYEEAIRLCKMMQPPGEMLPHAMLSRAKVLARVRNADDAREMLREIRTEWPTNDERFEREVQGILTHLDRIAQEGSA
jgi:tetratricopeptide (TPR) repeat protein